MKTSIRIGADGGGTRTTAIAVDANDHVLARVIVGGMNWFNIGLDAARAHAKEAVDRLLAETGADTFSRLAIGTAGLDQPATEQELLDFCGDVFDPALVTLVPDTRAALAGFARTGPAALVVCGTGSSAVVRDSQGREHPVAGWGSAIGDYGGGHTLARAALRAAMDARDDIGPATALVGRDLAFFGASDERRLAATVQKASIGEVAAFAKEVLALAAEGDAVAASVVSSQMRLLAHTMARALHRFPEVRRVGLHGGILRNSAFARDAFVTPLTAECPGAECGTAETPPEMGALYCER